MLGRIWRLLTVAAVALPLGACIISGYNITDELTTEFPIAPGAYTNKEGNIIDVTRLKNEYRVYSRKGKDTSYARLHKIPETSAYLLQFYDPKEKRKNKKVYYFFLKTTDNGFDLYDLDKLATTVPDHIAKYLDKIDDDDRRYNTVTVKDGQRNTLYVIRELTRTHPDLVPIEKESYQRVSKR